MAFLLMVAAMGGGAMAAGETSFDIELQQLLRSGVGRGDKLLKMTAETVRDEDCAARSLPYLRLIGSETYPSRATPGQTINHRLTYALCPDTSGAPLVASLTKRLFSPDQLILSEPNPNYQFRPGTWADDDQIEIPATARKGRYTIEVEIAVGPLTQRTQAEFSIE